MQSQQQHGFSRDHVLSALHLWSLRVLILRGPNAPRPHHTHYGMILGPLVRLGVKGRQAVVLYCARHGVGTGYGIVGTNWSGRQPFVAPSW
jgi:hypothetical protein